MKNTKWKKIKTERVYDHKFFKVNKDIVELPGGEEIEWLYWDSHDSAMIVPVTCDNKLVMIKQYRYLPNQIALEFPSGRANEKEDIEITAKRELTEETGYTCDKLEKLGEFYETMAQLNRKIHIYLAKSAKPLSKDRRIFQSTEQDEHEETKVVLLDLLEVLEMVRDNKIISMGSSLAALLTQEYLKEGK
jgi:ADP-ribose pyrophosphatase